MSRRCHLPGATLFTGTESQRGDRRLSFPTAPYVQRHAGGLALLVALGGTSYAATQPAADEAVAQIPRERTTPVSVDGDGKLRRDRYRLGNWDPTLSGDGRHAAFYSYARLSTRDGNDEADVYVRDLVRGATRLVSVGATGNSAKEGYSGAHRPAISANGRYVAFWSHWPGFVPGDIKIGVAVWRSSS